MTGPTTNLPFYLHAILTLPAFLNFFTLSFHPTRLPPTQLPHILRNYAFLLLSTCATTLVYTLDEPLGGKREKDGHMALALGIYHIAPIWRAVSRIWGTGLGGRERAFTRGEMGGPGVHLITHVVVLGALIRRASV